MGVRCLSFESTLLTYFVGLSRAVDSRGVRAAYNERLCNSLLPADLPELESLNQSAQEHSCRVTMLDVIAWGGRSASRGCVQQRVM